MTDEIFQMDFTMPNPDYKVYIPTDTHHEMYSHVAAAVALYDRKMKCG